MTIDEMTIEDFLSQSADRLTETEGTSVNNGSSLTVAILNDEDLPLYDSVFVGFGVTGSLMLISITISVLIYVFKRL